MSTCVHVYLFILVKKVHVFLRKNNRVPRAFEMWLHRNTSVRASVCAGAANGYSIAQLLVREQCSHGRENFKALHIQQARLFQLSSTRKPSSSQLDLHLSLPGISHTGPCHTVSSYSPPGALFWKRRRESGSKQRRGDCGNVRWWSVWPSMWLCHTMQACWEKVGMFSYFWDCREQLSTFTPVASWSTNLRYWSFPWMFTIREIFYPPPFYFRG